MVSLTKGPFAINLPNLLNSMFPKPLLSAAMSLCSPYEVQTQVDVFVSFVEAEVLSGSQVTGTFVELTL